MLAGMKTRKGWEHGKRKKMPELLRTAWNEW